MLLHPFISLIFVLCTKPRAISFASCNDFFDLTLQPYFVDKTELLMELFNKSAKIPRPRTTWNFSSLYYYYITCPRGFGKTTNLKMIQSFAQYELGRCNLTKPYNDTKAYEVFGRLKISECEETIRDNMGQYSVMYLDLTFQAEDLISEDTAAAAFAAKLADMFKPYEWYMKNVTQVGAHTFLVNLLEGKVEPKWIHRAAFYVGKTLSRIGGKGTLFLVDNFDSAARISMLKPLKGVTFLYTLIHRTLCEFAHFIKSENADHRRSMSLITGISEMRFKNDEFNTGQIFRRSLFLKHDIFSRHFGFVQHEIDTLMDKYNCSKEEKSEAEKYYKGYKTDPSKLDLYNPVSITEYLKAKQANGGVGKLEPYWARNESLDFVAEFAKAPWFRKKLIELIAKNELRIESPIHEHESTFLLSFLDWSQRNYENIDDDDAPLLLYYFYEHGFLRHKEDNPWYAFEFANIEVQNELTKRLKETGVSV